MSLDYSSLRFGADFFCPGCKERIVRRYTFVSPVNASGHYVDASAYDGYSQERLYELTCPKCGKVTEIESPRDVEEFKGPAPEPGPRIVEVS
jgi:hypothetical protein